MMHADPLCAAWSPAEPRWRMVARIVGSIALLVAFGLFFARAPLAWGLVLIAACMGGVLLLLKPALALYALAFTIPFGSLYMLDVGGFRVGPSQMLVLGLAGSWGLHTMCLRRRSRPGHPGSGHWDGAATHSGSGEGTAEGVAPGILWFLGLYLGILLLSFLPGRNMAASVKEFAKWLSALLVYWFLTKQGLSVRPRLLVGALLLAGMLEGVLGIYQFFYRVGPPGFVWLGGYMRAHGTFEQPNPFGGYLGLLLPLAYTVALSQGRKAWRGGEGGALILWALAVLASITMLAGLVMSWSRGALLGLLGGFALVVLAWGRRIWLPLGAVALLLLLALGPSLAPTSPAGLVGRLLDVTGYLGMRDLSAIEIDDENFAVVERLAHWDAAWRMFERSPWVGVGTGQYAEEYPALALPRWQDPLGHAHNYYLHALAETGILGLAGYLAFVGAALAGVWRAARRSLGWPRLAALGALGMLGHLLAHSLVDNLYVHDMYLLVTILLGLVVVSRACCPADAQRRIPLPHMRASAM